LSLFTFSFDHCVVCSSSIYGSCSTSDTRCVNLVTNPVISREWGKDRKCLRQVEHIRGHLWHRYSITVASVKFSKWWLQLYQYERNKFEIKSNANTIFSYMWMWHYNIIHPLIYSILESTDLFTLSWDLFLPYNDNITIYVKLTFILPYSSNGKVDNETQNRWTYNTGNCYST
jgi:hypothetical protein